MLHNSNLFTGRFLIAVVLGNLVLFLAGCVPGSPMADGENIGNNDTIGPVSGSCQRLYQELKDEERAGLNADLIVLADNGQHYFISPKIVPDCDEGIRIGRFLRRNLLSNDEEGGSDYVPDSKVFVNVLRSIWNSRGFSTDGVRSEKYYLLMHRSIRDNDLAPFLSELLQEEDLFPGESGLQAVLINRPIPAVRSDLSMLMSRPEYTTHDRPLFLLIALYLATPDAHVLKRIDKLSETHEKRLKLKQFQNKLRNLEKVTFRDLEELRLRYDADDWADTSGLEIDR